MDVSEKRGVWGIEEERKRRGEDLCLCSFAFTLDSSMMEGKKAARLIECLPGDDKSGCARIE